mgnify:CR=1
MEESCCASSIFLIFKGFDYLVFKEDEQVNYFKLSTYYSFGLMLVLHFCFERTEVLIYGNWVCHGGMVSFQ